MSDATDIILRAAAGIGCAAAAGFGVVWAVGGAVGTWISRYRDSRSGGHEVPGPELLDRDTWPIAGATDPNDELTDPGGSRLAEWRRVLADAPTPAETLTQIRVSSPILLDWINQYTATTTLTDRHAGIWAPLLPYAGIPLIVDRDLPAATIRYVYADGRTEDQGVSAIVADWAARQDTLDALTAGREQADGREAHREPQPERWPWAGVSDFGQARGPR